MDFTDNYNCGKIKPGKGQWLLNKTIFIGNIPVGYMTINMTKSGGWKSEEKIIR